ncbi:hypothetical protein QE439_000954 [Pedobacter agri]|nr:hypothetical protein [Pedobacter agri]
MSFLLAMTVLMAVKDYKKIAANGGTVDAIKN